MKKIFILLILVGIAGFLWWAFSPLLFTTTVDDELPPSVSSSTPLTPEPASSNAPTTTQKTAKTEVTTEAVADTKRAVQNVGPFPIVGTDSHPASGDIRLVITPEEQLVRYENYQGTNGPDLKIYLANDLEANDYIELAPARGNAGNINYGVPLDVDLSEYKYVLTWCEAFGVLFDYAQIN